MCAVGGAVGFFLVVFVQPDVIFFLVFLPGPWLHIWWRSTGGWRSRETLAGEAARMRCVGTAAGEPTSVLCAAVGPYRGAGSVLYGKIPW